MSSARKTWLMVTTSPPRSAVPVALKARVSQQAQELVDRFLKPEYIKPPPGRQLNYIIDIFTKWYRSYFYFCAKYRSPGPNALSPDFETKFARMTYVGRSRFNLSYMRHTGEWFEIYQDLTLEKCLSAVKEDGSFQP